MTMPSVAPAPTPAANPTTPQAPISTDPPPAAPPAPAAFDWTTAGLDPDGLTAVTAKGWKGPSDVVTSYRQLETVIGVPPERVIKLPKDAADPKAWNEVYTKLGRPETPDKYVIPVPEGDKGEFATAVKPWLHEAGLSQSQAMTLATKWNGHLAQVQAARQAEVEAKNLAEVSALKQAWGGEYDTRANLVDKAAETFGMTQAQVNALKDTMGPKAAMEFLYTIGSKLGVEDSTVPGLSNQGSGFGVMSPEMAQAEIARLSHDPTFAQLHESKDPKQRQEARAQMDRLQKLAYPGVTPITNMSAAPRRA